MPTHTHTHTHIDMYIHTHRDRPKRKRRRQTQREHCLSHLFPVAKIRSIVNAQSKHRCIKEDVSRLQNKSTRLTLVRKIGWNKFGCEDNFAEIAHTDLRCTVWYRWFSHYGPFSPVIKCDLNYDNIFMNMHGEAFEKWRRTIETKRWSLNIRQIG